MMNTLKETPLKKEYDELVKRAEEQHPGIFELLSVYQQQQASLQQSQDYLHLFSKTFVSSTSNSSQ